MRITNLKLKKGQYPIITFHDGNVEVVKNYPNTEAPPKLLKAMMSLNSHVTEMTEQYGSDSQHDYDNVCARSYSLKGEGEKEGIVITGLRTLSSGKTIVINSPFVNLDTVNSEYPKIGQLLTCLDNINKQIEQFMKSNPSTDDIQGRLQFTKLDSVVVESEETAIQRRLADGDEVDVTDLYQPFIEPSPMSKEMYQAANDLKADKLKWLKSEAKVRTLTSKEQEQLQTLTAAKNKKK